MSSIPPIPVKRISVGVIKGSCIAGGSKLSILGGAPKPPVNATSSTIPPEVGAPL